MTDQANDQERAEAPGLAASLGVDMSQMYQASACAFEAWGNYWAACLQARDIGDLYAANTALLADSVSLAGHVAGVRQLYHGVVAPTLNEA
jgi:hypothetical protein